MVVRFDLERDREPVADRDDPRVLAGAGDDTVGRRAGRQRSQQRSRALVRAVLAPHHAEHRQLEVVRVAAAEAVPDRGELVVGDAEAAVERLLAFRRTFRRDRHRQAAPTDPTARPPAACRSAALAANDAMIPSPSSEPRTASTAVSGWGISPATLPAAFVMPAIARREPFGFARSSSPPAGAPSGDTYRKSTWPAASSSSSVASSAKKQPSP